MKKAIGMLVMLMGLTANAQTYPSQDQVKENYPKVYTECVNNQLINSLDKDYNLKYYVDENGLKSLTAYVTKEDCMYVYTMDMAFNVIRSQVRVKVGEFTKTKEYKL